MHRSTLDRLDRIESRLRPAPWGTPAERASLASEVAGVLALAPPGADRDESLSKLLQRVDRGDASAEDLERIGCVDLSLVRIVSRLEASC